MQTHPESRVAVQIFRQWPLWCPPLPHLLPSHPAPYLPPSPSSQPRRWLRTLRQLYICFRFVCAFSTSAIALFGQKYEWGAQLARSHPVQAVAFQRVATLTMAYVLRPTSLFVEGPACWRTDFRIPPLKLSSFVVFRPPPPQKKRIMGLNVSHFDGRKAAPPRRFVCWLRARPSELLCTSIQLSPFLKHKP